MSFDELTGSRWTVQVQFWTNKEHLHRACIIWKVLYCQLSSKFTYSTKKKKVQKLLTYVKLFIVSKV